MFKVINHNPDDFFAKYNGVDYTFPTGMLVYLDEPAASHIFGLGKADKDTVLARHGWAGPGKTRAEGMRILNQFEFDSVDAKLDAPLASEVLTMAEKMVADQEAAELAALAASHGPAPVIPGASAEAGGADDTPADAGVVADSGGKRRRQPGFGSAEPI